MRAAAAASAAYRALILQKTNQVNLNKILKNAGKFKTRQLNKRVRKCVKKYKQVKISEL